MPETMMADVRPVAPHAERRRSDRTPLNRVGVIGVGWGHAIGESMVRDLSNDGARMTVAPEFGVPDAFVLLVADDPRGWRPCRVVRRGWCEIAVR
ncbi:MAG: hypothetical protein WCA36_05220, partial [Pseudolabrys sp.]